MYLYLVQHAKALSSQENPERPLSKEGRADAGKMAKLLSGLTVGRICESGKLRATETARLLGDSLGVSPESVENLSPMDNPGEWVGTLNETEEDMMLVGHLPHLGKLASLLLAGTPEVNIIEFSHGGVLCLKRDADAWTVQWMVVPSLLR